MRLFDRARLPGLAAFVIGALACSIGFAQEATTLPTTQPEVAAAAAPVIDSGSTAWMLISTALVFLMIPGLALFYGGMVRAKNVLNMFLCVMVACGIIGLHWVIVGYAMVFPVVGDSNALIWGTNPANETPTSIVGYDTSLMGLRSFNSADPTSAEYFGRPVTSGDTTGAKSTGVPELIFAMFQGMFAIITPALIVGAVAERIKFSAFCVFMLIWSTIVYAPVAHMVWNVNGVFFQMGALDFAGGTVVHVLAGVSSLALCLVVGPRKGFGKTAMPPHSLGYTLIGAGLLWFGWFGFNAGSAIAIPGAEHPVAGGVAGLAFATTQIAAAAAATIWMLAEWIHTGKPTILGFASGMVAGLVVITPCAGHVTPFAAILIGSIGGIVCYGGVRIKTIFGFDDSLDAFGVHGVGGFLGALLVGIFAIRPVMGGIDQFWIQLKAAGFSVIWAFVISFAIAYLIKITMGIRPSTEDEQEGLDITEHGEQGYNLSTSN